MIDFSNILYTPLDIPKLPLRNRLSIIEKYIKFSDLINKPSDPTLPVFWKGVTCYKSDLYSAERLLHVGVYLDLSEELSEDIDLLESHLPIDIETISLWSNITHVPSHVDKRVYDTDLDFRFRFILAQDKDSFFIDYGGRQRYISMPATTNTFCFNNIDCKHGSTYDENNFKILGVIRGKIRSNRELSDLLQKSVDTYNEYAYLGSQFLGKQHE
jgi:hypothetical protein